MKQAALQHGSLFSTWMLYPIDIRVIFIQSCTA